MRKYLANSLIIAAIILIILPNIENGYYDYLNNKLTKKFLVKSVVYTNKENTYQGKSEYDIYENYKELMKAYKCNSVYEDALLVIDKIGFKQVILDDATEKNLRISVASIRNHGKPGKGNYCIAGHRSKAYGKNFNRILELKNGDKINVICNNKIYQYKVSNIYKVKPEEVWVLEQSDKVQITLISCYPMYNPQWRIIIRGEMV